MLSKFTKNWYSIGIFLIIILGFFLRFYNYDNRWGLGFDQAHDAIIGRYTFENFKIPLVGPFSSGAQFQASGIWYVFIALATMVFPSAIITPWIILTVCFVLFIYLMIRVGKIMEGDVFALIVGLFVAISPSQVAQSLNLSLTSPMAFISLGAIYSMLKYVKTKNNKYLFLLSLFTSLGPTTHLSGSLLLIFLAITIIFTKSWSIKKLAIVLMGLIIPAIPLVIFDLRNDFVNTNGLLNSLFHNQFKISYEVLGRRWLTYIGVFWPSAWGYVIGGNKFLGLTFILGGSLVFIWQFLKKRLKKEWAILLISSILMVGAIRYVRTPIFYSYIIFLHPFMFFISGYLVYFLFLKRKIILWMLLLVTMTFSIHKVMSEAIFSTNNTIMAAKELENDLDNRFPNQKFAFYDKQYKNVHQSLPLVLLLYTHKKIDDKGITLGIRSATTSAEFELMQVVSNKFGYQIIDLSASRSADIIKGGWVFVNPSAIYKSTEEWYK
jgi:hypothetical protein